MATGAYDAPQYTVAEVFNLTTTAGANTVQTQKFVAFAALQLKAVQATAITAGTSATTGHCAILKVITAGGTTTTAVGTVALGTSSANVTTNTAFASTATMAQGDILTITNGTDATGVIALAIEYRTQPGATYTS